MTAYARYPNYKPTNSPWLESIPEHWEAKRLKDVATYNDEILDEKTDPDFEMEYVDISSVSLTSGIEKTELLSFDKAPSRARRMVKHGDVIVSTVRTYLKAIAPINNPSSNMVVSTGFAVIRPSSRLDPRFAGYMLQSNGFVGDVVANSIGVSYPAINASDLARLPVAEPPLPEQRKISDFLDYKIAQIDVLIAKKKCLLEKLVEQRAALISQAVTKGLDPAVPMKDSGVEWIGEVPAHWLLGVKLNYLSAAGKNTFVNGPFGSDLLTSELTDEGVPVVYSGDIKPGRFINKSSKFVTEQKAEQLRFCRVDPGDLLLAKVGDPPGDAAIYPESLPSGIVTQDVVRIKLDNSSADAEYLSFLLNSLYGRFLIKQVSVESTRGRFSLGDFKSLRFVLPPVEEQISISNSLREYIRPLLLQEKKVVDVITLLQEYRSALITNAVTGKIDVRDFTAIHSEMTR